ncbi:MAG TPA: CBO0543 family protein [Bacillus sp. (in: firmicutes)]|nr:CBO0543 family protein [Bacillus sp. (in: firmicutes)]
MWLYSRRKESFRLAHNKAEKAILISSWVIIPLLLIRFVPKNRIRHAQVPFMFTQVITWFFGLLITEKGLITYPYRLLFRKSYKSSFTFEYLVFPSLSVFFNLYYPEKRNILIKALYYLSYTSFVTVFELIAVKYTKLIRYKKWNWYWSFITICITYYISRLHYRHFFKSDPFGN